MLRFLLILIFFGGLAFLLFTAFFSYSVKKIKSLGRLDLAGRKCPKCGSIFGVAIAGRAENTYLKEISEMMANNPGMRFSLRAVWPVTCGNCDWKGSYEPEKQELLAGDVIIEKA